MNKFGNKIVVVGVSASGKTTFTRKLASLLKLPPVLMDEIMWKPGWNYVGDEKTAELLEEASQKDEWIIEGYITKASRTSIFDRADKIIYLDYSPLVSSLRYIRRYLKHRKEARPELAGSPDRFSFKFLKLVWTKGEAISLNKYLSDVKDKTKIIKLKSPRQAEDFLRKFR